jgi:hypothetical protein
MKKKIFIALAVLFVILLGYIGYQFAITKTHSPAETKQFSHAGADIKVVYCKPYKKGRLIFGEEKDDALLNYGEYWRLGANEATEITFSKDVLFAGKPVSAGTYRMYAVPGASTWQISLNSELGEWGAMEPDYTKDVLKVDVPAVNNAPETEQFSITFSEDSTAAQMDFAWDKTRVSIPIMVQ